MRSQGEREILLCNLSDGRFLLRPSASSNKLLDKVASKIESKIHDGALLGK